MCCAAGENTAVGALSYVKSDKSTPPHTPPPGPRRPPPIRLIIWTRFLQAQRKLTSVSPGSQNPLWFSYSEYDSSNVFVYWGAGTARAVRVLYKPSMAWLQVREAHARPTVLFTQNAVCLPPSNQPEALISQRALSVSLHVTRPAPPADSHLRLHQWSVQCGCVSKSVGSADHQKPRSCAYIRTERSKGAKQGADQSDCGPLLGTQACSSADLRG